MNAQSKLNASAMLRTVAVLILVSELPVGVRANCWIDRNGFERCSSLSNGARIGIGVGVAVLFFLCFALLALARRRRLQAHYRSYLTQQQPQPAYQQPQYGGGAYGPQQEGYGAPNSPGYNQYPAPAGPPPGYNEPQPQVPGNVYRGSKV